MSGKMAMSWSTKNEDCEGEGGEKAEIDLGGEKRTGEEDEQRILLETGGEAVNSSNKDLFPHTMADMLSASSPLFSFFFLSSFSSSDSYFSTQLPTSFMKLLSFKKRTTIDCRALISFSFSDYIDSAIRSNQIPIQISIISKYDLDGIGITEKPYHLIGDFITNSASAHDLGWRRRIGILSTRSQGW